MNRGIDGAEPVNRPITAEERALIEWLLHHGEPGATQFLSQLDSLAVVSTCICGCPTVYFERSVSEPEHILADYLATVNGEGVGVILFERGGRLSSLDVYSQAGTDRPFGLPCVETIYSYEQLGEREEKRGSPNRGPAM